MKALSIRQPWAWLIANGYKDIENRNWYTRVRGPVLIHASKSGTLGEHEEAEALFNAIHPGIDMPKPNELLRGGIVGQVDIVNCVKRSESLWFFGDYGFCLANAKERSYLPVKGQLGFFDIPWITE